MECQVVLFDCDDFTQKFYKEYLGTDQRANRLDVSEKPVTHLKSLGWQQRKHSQKICTDDMKLPFFFTFRVSQMAKRMALVAGPKYLPLDAVVDSQKAWCNSQVNSSTPQWSGQRGGFLDIYADDQCQGLKQMDELCLSESAEYHPPAQLTWNLKMKMVFLFQTGDLQVPC